MRATTISIGAAALLLLAEAAPVRAGGYAVSEQTAVAGGTGGAATARADDAGAAWYNPAALADGGGVRLGVSLMAAFASLSAEGDGEDAGTMGAPWQTGSENGVKTPASLQISYASGSWAAGLALGVPFGSGVEWPTTWPGRFEIQRSQLTVLRAAPFFAWRFGRVSISAGPHIDSGRMQLARRLDFIDAEGDVAIDMDGWGIGGHASLFAEVTPEIDVGLSYKSRTAIDLEGGADFEAPLAFSAKAMDQRVKTSLTVPDRIALGARWERGALAVLTDVEVTLWGVHDQLTIDFERGETPDVIQNNQWKTSAALRAGGELAVRPKTVVRGGLFYDRSPVPEETLTPSSPDSDRLGATLGISQSLLQSIEIDAFYEALKLVGRDGASPEALSASYSGHAHFIGLGLRWQPAD